MTAQAIQSAGAEQDLIDRIAGALPEEVRAEYYRELRHCRSLPESDEMLRLLRAMQFLVLLMVQAPGRVAVEREKLDSLLASAIESIGRMGTASEEYHRDLERRLAELPPEIARGISPAAVAGEINEILRQEFMRSTIPQTVEALGGISDRMKKVCAEFSASAESIGNSYRGAAEDARRIVTSLKSEIALASEAATRFSKEVADRSAKGYRWSMMMLAGGSLVMGLAFGMMFERWLLGPPEPTVQSAPSVQVAAPSPAQPPAAAKAKTKK